ncbi:hypothetical protein [Vibrio splendidus]|uniref:hypothetical protein n=1 Tax=Vibrio splendidus TaxID=29497 RepID=UPI000D3B5317|nr:hypothetical protein [Vibrio splendidus]PTP52545.1 hypothetical protein CWN83_13480 [Vibrio splendidus]
MLEPLLSIYWAFFKRRPLIIAATLLIYMAIVAIFVTIAQQGKQNRKETDAVVTALVKSIDISVSEEIMSSRFQIIFNSHDRKLNGELQKYGYVQLLEDAFTNEATSNPSSDKLTLLLNVIDKEKVKDPFYGLKFEQELVIKNLESQLSDEKDKLFIVDQIKEIVRRQNLDIEELKKSNALGIPLGIAGLLFTVVFGLLGLSYPLLIRKK